MQKYKVVASKSQKKYTLIISADSEIEAKEKLHKDGYSLLSVVLFEEEKIEWNKFIFQVEKDWEIKDGIIVGKDIYKAYKKLKDDLEYHIIFLYPKGDEAAENAEKKQLIMEQLHVWYELQQQKEKMVLEPSWKNEEFYIKKQLDDTYELIEKVLEKLDHIFTYKNEYTISEEKILLIEKIYEKLKQIKKSTNISKLKEIGEKALIKIAEIEVQNISIKKDEDSKKLLKETNTLLKQIWSDKNFKEEGKDYVLNFKRFISDFWESIAFFSSKKNTRQKNVESIDTESYSFLKTLLLIEKYKEKLKLNTKEMRANIFLFINIFSGSEEKEKILLKRKVIQQNIALLTAKKDGSISSYTNVKKGAYKIIENISGLSIYTSNIFLLFSSIYISLFFFHIFSLFLGIQIFSFRSESIIFFLFFFLLYIIFSLSKNIFIMFSGIVFLVFFNIFIGVNF